MGLARRISPWLAQRYVGWAQILTSELPATLAALECGKTSEWRAMLVARETGWLSREHRTQVDTELAPRIASLGDRRVEAETRKLAYRLDPTGYLARIRGAEKDRRVSVRPAPDVMCRLTGLLPLAQGVAAYAALAREAESRIAAGDARGRGQIMADAMVERLTGQARAEDVPVEINLVMTEQTLLGAHEPAQLDGYGPLPAATARHLIGKTGERVPVWLRRLYRHPDTGQLISMDTRRRQFTATQRRFIRLRDQTCRTPWCDAPIRHTDHVIAAAAGGPTSISNAQGLCQACNQAKEAPGWQTLPAPSGEICIVTPTGHHYQHAPPQPPGNIPRTHPESRVEQHLRELLSAA